MQALSDGVKNRRIILQRLRSTENQGSQTSNVICKKMNIVPTQYTPPRKLYRWT